MSLWMTPDRSRWFLVPDGASPRGGELLIQSLTDTALEVDEAWLIPFQVTEDQARRLAKDELGHALGELKDGIDNKLADWRRQLDEFNRTPVTENTTVTPNAAPALLDFLKTLPGVIGNSLSGEDNRVAAAKNAMADLQRQLNDAGIDVGDGLVRFSDRLAALRTDVEQQRAAGGPTGNEAQPDKQ
jgi:hypothetical protein